MLGYSFYKVNAFLYFFQGLSLFADAVIRAGGRVLSIPKKAEAYIKLTLTNRISNSVSIIFLPGRFRDNSRKSAPETFRK